MRAFAALGLALMLAAFGPPQPSLRLPEGAQQTPPGSWIPAPKDRPPPAEYHAIPLEQKAPKPLLPDTCANGYVAPKTVVRPDLPPGMKAVTPEQMFERACAKKPPEKPDRQFVNCPDSREITRIELAKPLSDAYWFIGKSVHGDALAAIERAGVIAEKPEEKQAVALAMTKRANVMGDRAAEIGALEAQLGTGCLSEFSAGIVRSTIDYMRKRSQ